ncbi:MAG: elongation factor G [Candidatus Omnitrophota bacterium]
MDSAVIVIDANSGIEVGTERAWQILEDFNLPCIIFVNKIDEDNVDVNAVTADIKTRFSKNCLTISSLEDSNLLEAVAESDDKLLERYLEGVSLSQEELRSGLTQAVLKRKVFPVFCGSALTDKGIGELLDAIVQYLPNPAGRAPIKVSSPVGPDEQKEIQFREEGDLAAFVFKTIADPYVGQLTLLRIFSGVLLPNTGFYNVNKKTKERIGPVYILQGREQRAVEKAACGDIVAIAKLKETETSDSLADEHAQILFNPVVFPEPAISASVKPKSRHDEDKISSVLHKLVAEDPTFSVTHDPQSKELIISGLGDLHLDVMVGRIKKRFSVEVELGIPKVSYKETITKTAKVQGKFKRQSGGRGQYGDVWIEIVPLEKGKGLEFVDKVFGGAIPRNFIPSVEKGVLQACSEGAIAGYPIVDIRIILYDGSYHEVDSSDMAFQIAGSMALRKAVEQAGPVLLEPIMNVDVVIPEEYLGAISGDINSRRGHMVGMDIKGNSQIVKATVPLAEMFTYANDLRSLTGGRGTYTMKFSHYAEVPHKIISAIVSQYQASRKKEEEQ